jgi:hypothetical protein
MVRSRFPAHLQNTARLIGAFGILSLSLGLLPTRWRRAGRRTEHSGVRRREANVSGTELKVALTSERRDARQFLTPAGRSGNCEGRLRGPNRSTLAGFLCSTVRPDRAGPMAEFAGRADGGREFERRLRDNAVVGSVPLPDTRRA